MSRRWITFDLDGTLMQNPFSKWVFPEIAAAVSGQLGQSYDSVSALTAEHERRMEQGRYVEAYDWDEMLARLCQELGIEKSVDIEELVQKHSISPKVYLLEPEIPQLLLEMKAQGYALAAVTNGFYKYQAPVMQALSLLDCFDEVVTPERAGTGKPDTVILDMLAGKVVAHVGDRLDHDILLANRANAVSVLIERGLSQRASSLFPVQRPHDDEVVQVLQEKRRKESGRMQGITETVLPSEYRPTIVIRSIQELMPFLKEWKGG
ncbi:HAD family hydrolase [Brevibacillus invocatus]|uniref:HAD family hydrolase n=1 Tax=Brevibacillus invocatus TaxID=173959 RepID=A0A3M8C643_9BACL|nr:HAD family hydrolase [Brevibacillus invocatus]EAO7496390.1 HAD family hydrolase [Salmonella enterica]RNB70385.1 HAD family hydrolase [Brevibacillus invocatus]